jgi:hypothetical protein
MNIQQLRQRQGEAKSKANKDQKPQLDQLMAQVEAYEKQRLAWVGKLEAAKQAQHQAQGEIEAAESNLRKWTAELEALIEAV